jgi:hypothetical protein
MINTSSLQKIMANAQRMGDSQTAELARSILDMNSDIGAGTINTVTELGLGKNLDFNLNVIEAGVSGPYIIRLPYPPVKGKSSTVINNTGYIVSVFPSIEGGSINGVINSIANVPPDGKPYTFYCWENPLPGAWTWSPPAISQYDSREIVVTTPGSSNVITMVDPNFFNTSVGLSSSGGGATQPLFMKDVPGSNGLQSMTKPPAPWNSITKVKVYTNILTLTAGLDDIGLYSGGNYSVVDNITGAETGVYPVNSSPYINGTTSGASWQTVPGTPAAGAYSANIGDPGTKYIEMPCIFFSPNISFSVNATLPTFPSKSSTFGSVFLGTEVDLSNNTSYNKWFTQYFWLYLIPRGSSGATLKVRFFIEYN